MFSTDAAVASKSTVAVEDSDEQVNLSKIKCEKNNIELVMKWAKVNKQQATRAYIENNNNVLNAIMDIKNSNG